VDEIDARGLPCRIPRGNMAAGLLEGVYKCGDTGTEEVVHGQIDVLGVGKYIADGSAGVAGIRQDGDLALRKWVILGVGIDRRLAGDVAEERSKRWIICLGINN
jgi:hypothetical protein